MNTDRHKPFTFAQKKKRLYRGAFIISGDTDNSHFYTLLETGVICSNEQAVKYIDDNGEWLD